MGSYDQEGFRNRLNMNPLFVLGVASFAFGLAAASLVGGMAMGGEAPRRFSRKVFHAIIFTGAVPAQLLAGFWGVVVYGTVISLIVFASNILSTLFSVSGAVLP